MISFFILSRREDCGGVIKSVTKFVNGVLFLSASYFISGCADVNYAGGVVEVSGYDEPIKKVTIQR